jgi:hypothetical protein
MSSIAAARLVRNQDDDAAYRMLSTAALAVICVIDTVCANMLSYKVARPVGPRCLFSPGMEAGTGSHGNRMLASGTEMVTAHCVLHIAGALSQQEPLAYPL